MASAPILDNCTNRILVAGGQVDKNQDHPPLNEVIDIDDPHVKCSYLGGDNNAVDNYGIVGGILGPNAVPLLCGGLSIGEPGLQLASIFLDD